jgi:hypothetical protein
VQDGLGGLAREFSGVSSPFPNPKVEKNPNPSMEAQECHNGRHASSECEDFEQENEKSKHGAEERVKASSTPHDGDLNGGDATASNRDDEAANKKPLKELSPFFRRFGGWKPECLLFVHRRAPFFEWSLSSGA